MSDNKLSLEKRTISGKKVAKLRADGLIPSVVYGDGNEPILAQSSYNDTEKVLKAAGYHSTIDITVYKNSKLFLLINQSKQPLLSLSLVTKLLKLTNFTMFILKLLKRSMLKQSQLIFQRKSLSTLQSSLILMISLLLLIFNFLQASNSLIRN